MALSPLFRPVSFDALPGWRRRRQAGGLRRFPALRLPCSREALSDRRARRRFRRFRAKPIEARGGSSQPVRPRRGVLRAALRPGAASQPEDGGQGFVTGFYEPEVEASPVRTEQIPVPLLSRPADLVDVDDHNRPAGLDPYLAFGRSTEAGIVEYFDRPAIEQGALAGKGPGDRLARATRSMSSSSMYKARRG